MKKQNETNIKNEKYYWKERLLENDSLEVSVIVSKTTNKKYVQKKYKFHNKNEMLQNDKNNKKFVSEIKAMKAINSPFVVKLKEIYATTIPEWSLNIIMEYVDGNNLQKEINEGKHFSFEQITDWIIYICLGLHEIHSHNIIHRDLKPANIFLTKDKRAKIGDFDQSKLLKSKNDLTTSKVGTLIFQSPEKYKREQYYTDDDMWSLGIIIYELITLEHPFNLKNNFENNLLNGKYPTLGENVEEEFKQLVGNLLKVNRKDRPSAIEVLKMDFITKRMKVLLDTKKITKEDIPTELYTVIMAVTDYSKINTEIINTPIKMNAQPIDQNHRYSESFQILNDDTDSPRETITQRVSKKSELLINEVINNRMSKSQAEKYREVSNNLIRNIGNDAFNNLLNLAKKHDNYGLNDFKENIKLSLQIDHKSISEIDKTLKLIDDIYSIIKSIC